MSIAPGTQIGRYEVIEPIGAGGMGEVYRAHDQRLRRDVALKILPGDLASDSSRRTRFEHEARSLAALNHSNILNVYDAGTDGPVVYIVTELVAGRPLRGKLPVAEAIDAARQIACGLAAAHSAGVTHRDLKPDNILRTREGRLKIVDFGLAKTQERSDTISKSSETQTVLTQPGLVVGTLGYMSPEQVRGAKVDARSDIFNFGLILYEMLSGERAFQRTTAIETLHAILKDLPPPLPVSIPAALQRIVWRCLEKDPERRFQTATDAGFALSLVAEQAGGPALPGNERKNRERLAFLAAGTVLLIGAVLAGHWWWTAPRPQSWSGVALGGPEFSYSPQVSPDGHTLAMVGAIQDCLQPIVMTPATGNYAILSQDRTHGYAHSVTWSPDGAVLYFARLAGGPAGVFSVPALGGEVRLLLPNAAAPRALRDGSLLLNRMNENRRFQVYRFWPESGRLEALPFLLRDENRFANTAAVPFPDGKRALIYAINVRAPAGELPHLYVLDLDTGASQQLPSELENGLFAIEVSRRGAILLSRRRGQLYEVVETMGTAAPARVLFTTTIPVTIMSGAADGSIYADQQQRSGEVIRFSPAGGAVEIVARIPEVASAALAVLPDGRAVLGQVIAGKTHLVAVEKGKNPVDLLTTTEEINRPFAANAAEVAFALGGPQWDTIGVASLTTGRITRRISPGKGLLTSVAFSPISELIYFSAGGYIWSVDPSGRIEKLAVGDSVAAGRDFLSVRSRENGTQHLYRVPLKGGAGIEVQHKEPLHNLNISPNSIAPDGRILSSVAPVDSWFFPPAMTGKSGRLERISIDYQGDIHSMAWTPDGKVIALTQVVRARVWKFTPQPR